MIVLRRWLRVGHVHATRSSPTKLWAIRFH